MLAETAVGPAAGLIAYLRTGAAGGAPPDLPDGVTDYATLYQAKVLPASELADAIARYHGLDRARPDRIAGAPSLTAGLSRRFLRDSAIYPFDDDGRAVLAVADPTQADAIDAVRLALGRPVTLEVAALDEIVALFEREAGAAAAASAAAGDDAGDGGLDETVERLQDLATGAPVVQAVDAMLESAADLAATDIHIEARTDGLRVRLRVDGLLRPYPTLPAQMGRAIISRVKILAGLNIAERRLPQDGRARVRIGGREADLRVATMPTLNGEAAVIRILVKDGRSQTLSRLGMEPRDLEAFRAALAEPHGLIVVSGPTGSGKTTTLAAALSDLNDPSRKIITVEDPIEYQIPGVHQTQVKPSIDLTFATALRAFLRHDPDVIMVGEMRDAETATIGIQAALTGHLVLTTLHTNSAVDAITRLLDLRVESFLLASALRCVVGQRLVRRLCERCRVPGRPLPASATWLVDRGFLAEGETVWAPQGCAWCGGTGFRGRTAIFEVLTVGEEMRRQIRKGIDTAEVLRLARAGGMRTMLEDGIAKARAGVTAVEEVLRVTS